MTPFVILEALGLRLRVEEDPDASARLRHRWTPRQGTRTNRPPHAMADVTVDGPTLQALEGISGSVMGPPANQSGGWVGAYARGNRRRARSAALARAAANTEGPDRPAA